MKSEVGEKKYLKIKDEVILALSYSNQILITSKMKTSK
jgi:hypothetical protein